MDFNCTNWSQIPKAPNIPAGKCAAKDGAIVRRDQCLKCKPPLRTPRPPMKLTVSAKPQNLSLPRVGAPTAQPKILANTNVAVTPIAPVPFEKWNMVARGIYRRRRPGEDGIGSTLARIIDRKGGALYKKLYKLITGEDCPCADRERRLNMKFPYPVTTSATPPQAPVPPAIS